MAKNHSTSGAVGRSSNLERGEIFPRQLYLFQDFETFPGPGKKRKMSSAPCEWKIVSLRECTSSNLLGVCNQPQHAFEYWHANIATGPLYNPEVECFVVLILNTKYRVRGHNLVSIGSLNETIAHPREVFRAAVIGAAYGVVLMHNHPSGDPQPSDADMRTTRTMVEAGKILRIEVTDHIIVGYNKYYSFREAGII